MATVKTHVALSLASSTKTNLSYSPKFVPLPAANSDQRQPLVGLLTGPLGEASRKLVSMFVALWLGARPPEGGAKGADAETQLYLLLSTFFNFL